MGGRTFLGVGLSINAQTNGSGGGELSICSMARGTRQVSSTMEHAMRLLPQNSSLQQLSWQEARAHAEAACVANSHSIAPRNNLPKTPAYCDRLGGFPAPGHENSLV
jgi:hypothetical protein